MGRQGTTQGNGPQDAIELRLARSAVGVVGLLAIPALAIATAVAGPGGALGAGIAAAVVGGMFIMAGALMSWAARIGPTALMAAVLGGYLLRLLIYALLIVLLRPVETIHGPSLAITAAVLLLAALAWDVRLVSRVPSFYWVNTAAAPRPPRTEAAMGPGGPGAGVVYTRDLEQPAATPAQDIERTRS